MIRLCSDPQGTHVFGEYMMKINEEIIIGKDYPIPVSFDPTVEPQQVKIQYVGNCFYASDASKNGTSLRVPINSYITVPYGLFTVCGKTWITPTQSLVKVENEQFQMVQQFTP